MREYIIVLEKDKQNILDKGIATSGVTKCNSWPSANMSKSKKTAKRKIKTGGNVETSLGKEDNRTMQATRANLHDTCTRDELTKKCYRAYHRGLYSISSTLLCEDVFPDVTIGKVPNHKLVLAVKKFDMSVIPNNMILLKLNIIKQFKHQNLVSFVDCFLEECKYLNVAIELKGISLAGAANLIRPNESAISVICHEVLQGLIYLHDLMIIHRNIRPENIVIRADGTVKLGDFGLDSCFSTRHLSDPISTLDGKYSAPELLKGQRYGRKVDVWSLGVVTVYMKRFDCRKNGKPADFSPTIQRFVDRCLRKNPEKRVYSKQLAQSTFVVEHGSFDEFRAMVTNVGEQYVHLICKSLY